MFRWSIRVPFDMRAFERASSMNASILRLKAGFGCMRASVLGVRFWLSCRRKSPPNCISMNMIFMLDFEAATCTGVSPF